MHLALRDTPRVQPPAYGAAQVNEAAESAAAASASCVHEGVKKGGRGRGEEGGPASVGRQPCGM